MLQKAVARMDKYGRREVVDNDWLIREVICCSLYLPYHHSHIFWFCACFCQPAPAALMVASG